MNDLRKIPGIGRKMEEDLRLLDIESVEDLNGNDPELLYDKLCILKGYRVDRCVLYVFRCAVYYATEKNHDPEKLKWWNWKDANK
jgi:nucleotidyltransferase/DNA polymerase involved in DNA repair